MKFREWTAMAAAVIASLSLASSRERAAPAPTPTFNKDVAPILFRHCASCHRPGQVAPFSLLSYRDAAKRASLIAAVTARRYMPPWKPLPGYGDFADANSLTEEEIATLGKWAAAHAPEGDSRDLPPAPQFAEGWQLGPPDLILKMPHAFAIPPDGEDIYQCFVLPMNLPQGAKVRAVEVHPGNRQVLHHALLYLNNDGSAREREQDTAGVGYRCFGGPGVRTAGGLSGWVPGAAPRLLPEGVAMTVPQGSDLVMQNHYHPSGKPETDQSELGIYFAKEPVTKTVFSIPLMHRWLSIPAGDAAYQVTTTFVAPIDLEVISVAPHMHLLGRSMRVSAALPDGRDEPMICIKDWDFNWQGRYQYREPLLLPKGTRIEIEATYDNSAGNPKNPHSPPQTVHWGENTTDEMCLAFIQCETRRPEDRQTVMLALGRQLQLLRYRRFETDHLLSEPRNDHTP